MANQRWRFLIWAAASLAGIWLVALAGHRLLESRRMTAEKVRAYAESVNLGALKDATRAKALKELEDKLNALSYEERQRLRAERLMNGWLAQMTEPEKEQFIEATMPTGFRQMINAFEQLPDEKRRKVIDDALKNLRTAGNRPPAGGGAPKGAADGAPLISPELEAKIRTIGLSELLSKSSAQTKAEVAPLLEELQRWMESGRLLRQR
jgi:hypothetical protein